MYNHIHSFSMSVTEHKTTETGKVGDDQLMEQCEGCDSEFDEG